MLKYALLAGVMTIAAPAIAQTQANTAPTSTQSAPQAASGQVDPATTSQAAPATTSQAAPAADPQAQPAAPMDSTAAAPVADAAQSAAAEPAVGADQVATVVQTEFPAYDANKDGKLEKTEFASWMVKLKQVSDPKASATSAETKSWVNAAFAQADKDKNQSLTQPELIGFLSQGQS